MVSRNDGEDVIVVHDVAFALEPMRHRSPVPGALLLRKPRWMIERYQELAAESGLKNIFELGIDEGGSTAFLALLLRPHRLVAIDIDPEPSRSLARFIDEHELNERVRPLYGVDQSDRGRLEEILGHEFGDEPLDMVVDDASHRSRETVISFSTLFPRLRAGGIFVIEDWSWDHAWERAFLAHPERLDLTRQLDPDRVGPSRFVLQLVLACASSPEYVSECTVRSGFVEVRRGPASIDAESFSVSSLYGHVGRRALHSAASPPRPPA